jgi:ankyrin repeat protein
VQALLDQGVPPDAPDAEGETALMQSIRAGHPTVVTLLVSHGASLDWTNSSGETARSLAAAKADRSINRALGLER